MEYTNKKPGYKIVCDMHALKTIKEECDPITKNCLEFELNTIKYENLKNLDGLYMVVRLRDIHPTIEDGVLKSLVFETSNIFSEKEHEVKMNGGAGYEVVETDSKNKPEEKLQIDEGLSSFCDRLGYNQKQKLGTFLEKIKELRDNKIRVESQHKQHVAIKYHQGRSKAWMVIKISGRSLYLWLRVDPKSFRDNKNLTVDYDDSSKTHGNRRLDLMNSEMEDVMELVRQSYEFRKRDDFYDKYSEIVQSNKQIK